MPATKLVLLALLTVLVLTGSGSERVVGAAKPIGLPRSPILNTVAAASPTPLIASASASAAPSPADPATTDRLIDHTYWGSTDKGRQLQIFPTLAGRSDTLPAASARAWQEVLADAPTANTPGMYDQFLCHWNFARFVDPSKRSWNLEPWRPAVGYRATVGALCNPGGPES